MTLNRTPVKADYQVDFRSKASCEKSAVSLELFPCGCALQWTDRKIVPVRPESLESDEYIGVRSYYFPTPMDRFSIYATFQGIPAAAVPPAFPSLKWRIQLGVGPSNERAIEGVYTPTEANETGLIVSFCSGVIFRTLDFCVNIEDLSGANRAMIFALGGEAMLATTCFPLASAGENGTITWIRKPTQPTPIVIP